MYRSIVVGWDGADEARDALTLARVLGAADGTVTAACVYSHPATATRPDDVGQSPWHDVATRARAEEVLARAYDHDRLDTAGLETVAVPGGSVADGLRGVVEERSASLLVVGSSRYGPLGRVHVGSVGRRLLDGPTCAVALPPRAFRQHGRKPRSVGIAFDASHQLAAVEEGAALASSLGLSVRLFCAIPPLEPWARGAGEAADYDWNDVTSRHHHHFRDLLDRAAARLPAPPTSAQLLTTRPARQLLAEADGIDLFVIGAPASFASGDLVRVLAGLTPGAAGSAPCPILVIPTPVEQGPATA